MTVTSTATSAGIAAHELRTRVRERLEAEYLRLRTSQRPALLELLETGNGSSGDLALVRLELDTVDERIAAVHTYLATLYEPHPDSGAGLDSCVLLDTGEDVPHWFLLASLPVEGERVIASDSSLGRAVFGTRPGQTFRYFTQTGPRLARLMDLEPSGSGSPHPSRTSC